MSQNPLTSQHNELTVKISRTTRPIALNSKSSNTKASVSNMFIKTLETIQSRRPTLRLEPKSVLYDKMSVTSSMQFFRDDWGGVTAIRYFNNSDKVAIGFNSGELQICSPVVSYSKIRTFETIEKGWEGNDSISCIQFHPKNPNVLYASSTAGTVMRRDLEDPSNYNNYFISEADNEIYSMDFTSSCELVTVGSDSIIRMYDVTKEKLLRELGQSLTVFSSTDSHSSSSGESCHEKRIYCVRCHPSDPSVIVSGGWDGVRVWDLRVRKAVRTIVGPFIFGDTVDICKGSVLTASCEARNCLQLWDLGSGFLMDDITPFNKIPYLYGEYPYVAKFYKGEPSGDLVLYGVGGLQLLSIKESSILYLFEDVKSVAAVDSYDKKLAFGGKSHTVVYGNVSFPESDTTSATFSCTSSTTVSVDERSEMSSIDT